MKIKIYFSVEDLGDGTTMERQFPSADERDRYVEEESQGEYKVRFLDEGFYILDTEGYEVVG